MWPRSIKPLWELLITTQIINKLATPLLKHLKAECVIPKHRINQMPVRCWCGKTNVKKEDGEKGEPEFFVFITRLNNASFRSSLLCLKLFAKRLKWMIELRHVAWKVAFSFSSNFSLGFIIMLTRRRKVDRK